MVVLVVQAGQLPTPTGALLRWFQSVILVSGSTQSIPTTFIIDTGAAVTLLCKDMWDKLPQGGEVTNAMGWKPIGRCCRESTRGLGFCDS